MPARVRPVFSFEQLPTDVSKIFDQAQSTTANHQKNLVALHKLHTEAASHIESSQHGLNVKRTGERAFEDAVLTMLSRVLAVKKGASVADRIMKFMGSYIKFMNEKALEEKQAHQTDENEEDDEDTAASRFITRLLRFLLKGSVAKDKTVRYRVMQCIAEMITHLGQIEEDLFDFLRSALLERLRDKENVVRAQAALILCRICNFDDPSESPTITEVLLDSLTYDTSPDVRRIILVNIPPGTLTIPAILARTRDVDATIRRSVYSTVLNPDVASKDDDKPDMEISATHPRALTIAQREIVVRNGLSDREEAVKAAASKVLSSWMDVVVEDSSRPEGEEQEKESNILSFLRLFDLSQLSIPEDALLSVFKARPDIPDSLEFPMDYWEQITPEKAFLARVFTDHCVAEKDDARLESALPVIGVVAGKIGKVYNDLQRAMEDDAADALLRDGMDDPEFEEQKAKREEEQFDREFVIGEMLKLALNLDYGDEIGRRMMFQLVREMISRDALPEGLVARCLDVLRKLSVSERDLIRVVVEVVHELRDPKDEDESFKDADDGVTNFGETPATVKTVRALPKPASEMTPLEKAQADAIDLRCLSLCIGMLERVNSRFEDNSTLEGILGELIVPAVKRKELALREKGLVSLGLCCLIARRMALNSFQLFLSQVQTAPEVLKLRVLQIVFDILMVNEGDFLGSGSTNGERIVEFLLHVLENEESEKVQALLCVGISKLMLSGMITDERVLRSLVLVYMSPETVDNQELRQCLTYFFPVYCYSSPLNQRRMQKIFVSVFTQLCQVQKDWEDDDDIVTPAQAGLLFVDWTDPLKASEVMKKVPGQEVDEMIHIDLAADITRALFNDELTKNEKKSLCQLFSKLHVPDTVDDDKLRTLKLLMHSLRARRPLKDVASKTALNKFEMALTKKFEQQLSVFNEEEYRQLEHLKELFEFLDDIIPLSDDEEPEPPKKRGARKRRSESVTTDASSTGGFSGDEGSSIDSKSKGKSKAKRRRVSQSDDESDDDKTERGDSPAVVAKPTRVMPRRSAAENAKKAVSESVKPPPDSSSEEEEEEGDEEEEEPPKSRRASARPRHARDPSTQASSRGADDSLFDQSHDSIMDTSLEDDQDADEVDDIL